MYASTVILTTRAFATLRRFCEHYWAEYPVVLFDDGEASLDFGVEGGVHLKAHPTYLTVNLAVGAAQADEAEASLAMERPKARIGLHLSPLSAPRWLHHLEALSCGC